VDSCRGVVVVVVVVVENDHSPTFVFPAPDNDTVAVSSDTPEGFPVAQLVARDRDADANGRLTYSLEADNVYWNSVSSSGYAYWMIFS